MRERYRPMYVWGKPLAELQGFAQWDNHEADSSPNMDVIPRVNSIPALGMSIRSRVVYM
jgi:hypothetical protein